MGDSCRPPLVEFREDPSNGALGTSRDLTGLDLIHAVDAAQADNGQHLGGVVANELGQRDSRFRPVLPWRWDLGEISENPTAA
jgi:hypothetical protein